MPKITLQNGDVTTFQGDCIICPSDVDLSYRKANKWTQEIFKKAGFTELSKELAAIGYCEIGNAVITKGYNLKVKHIIFLPYTDHENPNNNLNYILLHQALRAAFTLAKVYLLQSVAVPLLEIKKIKKEFPERLLAELFDKKTEGLKSEEIMDIIMSVSGEYKNTSLQNVTIYR